MVTEFYPRVFKRAFKTNLSNLNILSDFRNPTGLGLKTQKLMLFSMLKMKSKSKSWSKRKSQCFLCFTLHGVVLVKLSRKSFKSDFLKTYAESLHMTNFNKNWQKLDKASVCWSCKAGCWRQCHFGCSWLWARFWYWFCSKLALQCYSISNHSLLSKRKTSIPI